MAHFALQKLHIRPAVLAGECTINDPVSYKERVFIYASIMERVDSEKKEANKIKRKGG